MRTALSFGGGGHKCRFAAPRENARQFVEQIMLIPSKSTPQVVFRLSINAGIAMGPGKAALLRAIACHGSIAAAARELEMSYSRAWLLVRSMNEHFREPLVEVGRGGAARGGASVTLLGYAALDLYETMQAEAERAIATHNDAFAGLLKEAPEAKQPGLVAAAQQHP
jgi:molybdate transport system regulatory protein